MLLHSDEGDLYSGLKGGMIVLWDLYYKRVKLNLQGHSTAITAMNVFRQNKTSLILASASGEGKIKLWDLKSKKMAMNLKGHFTQVDCLSFSPDFTYLASGAQDGTLKLWDIRTNKVLKEINNNQKGINTIEFNPHQICFAYGGKDKTIKYYNLQTFNLLGQTNIDRLPIERIAFDNKGHNIFSATNEALKYWEVNNTTGLNLISMNETGWNKLQSFRCVEGKEICGLSSFGNSLSYYSIKYKDFFKGIKFLRPNSSFMSNIEEKVQEEDSSYFNDSKLNDLNNVINNNNNNISKHRTNSSKKIDSNFNMNLESKNLKNQHRTLSSKTPKNFNEYSKSNPILDEFLGQDETNLNIDDKNLGISKFINQSMTNATVNETNINNNNSKIENESVFMRNALNLMGIKTGNKYNDYDNRPLPKPKPENEYNKIYFEANDNNDEDEFNNKDNILPLNITELSLNETNLKEENDYVTKKREKEWMLNNTDNSVSIAEFLNESKNNDLKLSIIHKMNDNNNDFLDDPIFSLNNNNYDNFNDKNRNSNDNKMSMDEFLNSKDNKLSESNNNNNDKNINIDNKNDNNNNKNENNNNNDNNDNNSINNNNSINSNNIINNNNITNNNSNNTKILNDTTTSFKSIHSNETMGLDINKFMNNNNDYKNLFINDKDIIKDVNNNHDKMRKMIQDRYNKIKAVDSFWKKSEISKTLNALTIMKDLIVFNNFCTYGIISRSSTDINKIPFTIDDALIILPLIYKLTTANVESDCKTGCRMTLIFVNLFKDKINMIKKKINADNEMNDMILIERRDKCDKIIKYFEKIFNSSRLKKLCNLNNKPETKKIAEDVYKNLEEFLNPYLNQTNNIQINKNNNNNIETKNNNNNDNNNNNENNENNNKEENKN